MQLSNQWLILSTNHDDLRIITASDKIWGNATVIEKLVSKENDVRLFFPDGAGKEYVVLKQSLFSLKDLEEKYRKELGIHPVDPTAFENASSQAHAVFDQSTLSETQPPLPVDPNSPIHNQPSFAEPTDAVQRVNVSFFNLNISRMLCLLNFR